MKVRYVLCLLICFCFLQGFGQVRSHVKKHKKPYLKLVESFSRKTVPGMRGSPVSTNTYFIVVWATKTYPETFFWRGENGWLPCNMFKAHKIPPENRRNVQFAMEYSTEFVTGDQVHRGDTLQLSPIVGGKFPIPSEIPDSSRNDLYFKTGGSGWLKFHIDTIIKKHDLVMP